jgi:hypothetical protein
MRLILPLLSLSALVNAHGSHESHDTDLSERPPAGLTWEEWHMKQEHGFDEYTPGVFFQLHDTKSKGYLDASDILNVYGLSRDEVVGKGDGLGSHDDSESISKETKDDIVEHILAMIDPDNDGKISEEEYEDFSKRGGQFPDMNVGVGHHGDFEHEYEVHHWNKYHRDKDPEIKIVHKEDIEHELLHHEHEIEHQLGSQKKLTNQEFEARVKADNIPNKYRSY